MTVRYRRPRSSQRRSLLALGLLLLSRVPPMQAQRALVTDAAPERYLAAHGSRGFLGGNRAAGIEAYVYPLQVFRGLKVSFRVGASTVTLPGESLLRSYTYASTYSERRYVHPRFTVEERLWMAPGLPAGGIVYSVHSREPVTIELSFVPVLDLMWPAGVGGQEIHWQSAPSAYLLDEPTHRFAALVGSTGTRSHDTPSNSNAPADSETRLHLTLAPTRERTEFSFAASATGAAEAETLYKRVSRQEEELHAAAEAAESERRQWDLEIVTPDQDVNQAIAWAELALSEAWACNPELGCGLVGGYGPSRGIARRPQYAWFFAGDALVSLRAVLESGNFDRAKAELLFIMRYQNKQNGMVWHELSQSAKYLNWADYPYLFAHADITPIFLSGVKEYLQATGDVAFIGDHWTELEAAFGYLRSTLNGADGLPRVPAGKAGHDEQAHPTQELAFTIDTMRAAADYAVLARITGHRTQENDALAIAGRIRENVVPRFWNGDTHFWNSGIDVDMRPTPAVRLPPPVSLEVLSADQRSRVLARVDSPAFQTPWGVRSVASDSSSFDPASYATGSVWATTTNEAAAMLWRYGDGRRAWQTWKKLLPWVTLDAAGHIHEVLSGTLFKPQTESVAEQTWSSALMLSTFIDGVLGLHVDAAEGRLTLRPQLPEEWANLQVRHLRMGGARVDLDITREGKEISVNAKAMGEDVSLALGRPDSVDGKAPTITLNGKRCDPALVSAGRCTVWVPRSVATSGVTAR